MRHRLVRGDEVDDEAADHEEQVDADDAEVERGDRAVRQRRGFLRRMVHHHEQRGDAPSSLDRLEIAGGVFDDGLGFHRS
jgi:hypothetical protein